MNRQNELLHILRSRLLIKRALQGAGIAFVLICIFLLAVIGNVVIEAWLLVPIGAVTVGGALGGVFYFVMDILRSQGGWKKIWANVISIFVYLVLVYMSLILALSAIGLWD
jgi:hypothetical protein